MAKIIDIKTGQSIEPVDETEMISDWEKFTEKYVGIASCVIYYNKEGKLAYIAPSQPALIALIAGSYEMFKLKGVIKGESGKTGSGFCSKLFHKLRTMFSNA